MPKIKSIYDAILKYEKPEDKCTNFLLWLLEKLPTRVALDICKLSGLFITKASDTLDFKVQYQLENSRPDGLIEFHEGKYLLIETKLSPNCFDEEQFINHINGGQKEFGKENIGFLFLSGDEVIPDGLNKIKNRFQGIIGFLSWKSLLTFLRNNEETIDEKYKIIIDEFLIFARHYGLGRLISMNIDEMKKFVEVYPIVTKYENTVQKKFNEILEKIRNRIIMESEELVEANKEDIQDKMPCMYSCIKIKGWHSINSGYIFLNILLEKIGIILAGYQNDKKEKGECLQRWNENWKNKYKENADIFSFTWVDTNDDEYAINHGYFKVIEGTNGKLFNPDHISETKDCFYFGYYYDFSIDEMQTYPVKFAKDFKKLVDIFTVSGRRARHIK